MLFARYGCARMRDIRCRRKQFTVNPNITQDVDTSKACTAVTGLTELHSTEKGMGLSNKGIGLGFSIYTTIYRERS